MKTLTIYPNNQCFITINKTTNEITHEIAQQYLLVGFKSKCFIGNITQYKLK
jgi:hypothetical protein